MINFKKDMIPDLDYLLELYYHKILRVNLTTNSYEVIKMLPFEEDPKTSLSDWLAMFGSSNVADEDYARFTKYTDLTFMRENIGEIPINFRYKIFNSFGIIIKIFFCIQPFFILFIYTHASSK